MLPKNLTAATWQYREVQLERRGVEKVRGVISGNLLSLCCPAVAFYCQDAPLPGHVLIAMSFWHVQHVRERRGVHPSG